MAGAASLTTTGLGTVKYLKSKLLPPFKYHGGKSYLARWIIGHFPEHSVYIEPYAGGLSVLLNKPACGLEVVADVNAGLINLWRVLADRDRCLRLRTLLDGFPYAEPAYDLAKTLYSSLPERPQDEVQWALLFLCTYRMSRDGVPKCGFAWSERKRGGRPGDLNAWENMKGRLYLIHERVRGVRAECRDALEVIDAYDDDEAVIYLDPTYPRETRTATAMYDHEMTTAQHEALLERVLRCRARGVFLSTYPNELYSRVLGGAGWDYDQKVIKNHSSQAKTKASRVEGLWFRIK